MTEDNFEEFLRKTAQGYNVPPARTPREEMWSTIQAAIRATCTRAKPNTPIEPVAAGDSSNCDPKLRA